MSVFVKLHKFYFSHNNKSYVVIANDIYYAIKAAKDKLNIDVGYIIKDPSYESGTYKGFHYSEIEILEEETQK